MIEIYEKITKVSALPLLRVVKGMDARSVYNLAKYMYYSSSIQNEQYDLFFSDSRYKVREDIFIAIIYSVHKKVTDRYQFSYQDKEKLLTAYFKKFPYNSNSNKIKEKCAFLVDCVHSNDPLAMTVLNVLSSNAYRPQFRKFIETYLRSNNPSANKDVNLFANPYKLFWHISCPSQDTVGFQHAKGIASFNTVVKEDLVMNSFFDFMDT
jgi:microcystin degradation protein MlrC